MGCARGRPQTGTDKQAGDEVIVFVKNNTFATRADLERFFEDSVAWLLGLAMFLR
jgi:hypothetical protein